MNTEIVGIVAMFVLTLALAIPLGKYISKVYGLEKTWLDFIFNPLEKMFFKLSGVNPDEEMDWKQQLKALLTINLIWFVVGMIILMTQGSLPMNPDGNPSM